MRRVLSALAVTGCLLTSLPAMTWAQSLPGLTLFSGVKRENQLPFRLDFGGQTNAWDRYILRLPAEKMKLAVAQFAITYPKYYKGSFDTKKVEVIVKGKSLPLSEVKWDKEGRVLEIFPVEPVPAGSNVELVLNNVQNPTFGGIYYFNCQVLSPGDVPLLRYLGSWIISIS
ncbi:DUF2808 domain-containing protein [Anabaena cylindrica FACHB-243]|uniref:DUF2808 domain-containing protein n=1 Tax=Anabaena cylindrica (strain ATCC 27899 / PCC 7122) TaxID=272123 RepID=K9ZI83_ANACC|nr:MULTISPECIES: DUF2808 domain-containing protein [Anabaena]AFZ58252.1 hypothetical protein Anacy_2820 [Anabaena cylindrica PCC 7122]MBD2419900.1 DUF2808 domain-containing protein [Anabaena cylindrica FACHB-243]MBY5281026.1 DUF2808 domain-containing protein [Anabaena sp. CCAP 1446/1C]MBY5307323.1 DUF2808 domain-containing protein [Anabaena sp. CCAP 1446/1C]MCM2407898.1 DUF2808 domain-containing protein [Anabaena sp. CCAP 1446/1C]